MVGVEELEGRLFVRFRKKFDEFVFGLQRRAEPRTSYEHAPSTSHIQWYRKCEQPGHLRSIPFAFAFAFAGFTGLFCFFYCLIKYYRLLNDETAEAAKKDTPEKKAAAKTTDQEKSEKIVDSDGRAESAAESVVKESASTAAVEAPGVADEKAKLMAEA